MLNFPRLAFSLLLAPLLGLVACDDSADDTSDRVGGECTYAEVHGTCTFVDAAGGAEVSFQFTSDDGAVTDTAHLVVGDGGAPPSQDCLDVLGVTPGVEVGCTRAELVDGACSPVVYSFDTFETNDCLE